MSTGTSSDPLPTLLDGAETAWQAASALFEFWLAEDGAAPPRDGDPATCADADELSDRVAQVVGKSGDGYLQGQIKDRILAIPSELSVAQRAHAIATGIDEARSVSFTRSWLDQKGEE